MQCVTFVRSASDNRAGRLAEAAFPLLSYMREGASSVLLLAISPCYRFFFSE